MIVSIPTPARGAIFKILSSRFLWTVFFSCLLLLFLRRAGMPVHEFETFEQEIIHGLILGAVFACVCSVPAKAMTSLLRYARKKGRRAKL